MTNNKNINTNDNKDNNKINISINLAPQPQPEIKKKKKYKKRKPRLTAEDRAKILGSSNGNFSTQTPVNYLPKYADRNIGSGNFFAPQPMIENRLPYQLPYQLPTDRNGGIQQIPQIQQPQMEQQFQQQIQQPQQQMEQPRMINIDGNVDNQVLYDPINERMMRPTSNGRDIEMIGISDIQAMEEPVLSGRSIPKPTKPPPPIPSIYPEEITQSPPQDVFQDALEIPKPVEKIDELPLIKKPIKVKRLPAYIEKVGDNIQVEGTDYYVSKKDGLSLNSKLYSRVGRGRTANKLNYIGMTYGDYLNEIRGQQALPEQTALPPEQPLSEEERRKILREIELDKEVERLLNPSPSLPSLPRPPSLPKPIPPRPSSKTLLIPPSEPIITADLVYPPPSQSKPEIIPSQISTSTDLVFPPVDTPERLNFWIGQYPNIKAQDFDKLTTNLRNAGIPFNVPRNLRGLVKLMPDEIDVNKDLPIEDRPDTSEKKNKTILGRISNVISKYRQKSNKISPDVSPATSQFSSVQNTPLATERQITQRFPEQNTPRIEEEKPRIEEEKPKSFIQEQASVMRDKTKQETTLIGEQASIMRDKTKNLLDETTQEMVISTIELPEIKPDDVETNILSEGIETTILPEEDFSQKMIKEAQKLREKTKKLFDEITEEKVFPTQLNEIQPQKSPEEKFKEKYFEIQRQRPSSAKNKLEEAIYKEKMDEIKKDLETFDREYGFNYENYLEAQSIKEKDIKKMADFMIKKYGISHQAADLYIKEFLDTLNDTDRKNIIKDYEQTIKSNVLFYITKISRGIATRNLVSRLSGNATDDQKRELFLRTLIDTNNLTSNYGMFLNQDFREYLFQQFCQENNISLDNPKTLEEIITPTKYPYGARRKIVYRKPSTPHTLTPPTPSSTEQIQLKFEEPIPKLPNVIEEKTPPKNTKTSVLRREIPNRTKKEMEEMRLIKQNPTNIPPPPPPRKK